MHKIELAVLNPAAIAEAEKMVVAMARLTQRGHRIGNLADFMNMYNAPYTPELLATLLDLPHPTIQKFEVINIAIVGASRRFLAQITRHQNETKFMSGSLQYSDYSVGSQFLVPYEIIEADSKSEVNPEQYARAYLLSCEEAMATYRDLASVVGNDAAGYAAPQGLRNVLVISATPYQWKHIIKQRICRRNTPETMYILLRCWEELLKHSAMFEKCGPDCVTKRTCPEGKMSCRHFLYDVPVFDYMDRNKCSLPTAMLAVNFPLL